MGRGRSQNSAVIGIERLLVGDVTTESLETARLGLLSNGACRLSCGETTLAAVANKFGIMTNGSSGLVHLFSPEHGWNVSESAGSPIANGIEPVTGLPIQSLYGSTHEPDAKGLDGLDALIIDLPDVGVRCYTYAATAALLAKAAHASSVEVYLCDRPNPLGTVVAGPPRLDPELRNFLAYFDVPFVHGLRIGGLFAAAGLDAGCPGLTHISCAPGLGNEMVHEGSWQAPSPALSCPEAISFYPGLVLLEGTNMSEGRGTGKSFRSVLRPGLAAEPICHMIAGLPNLGVAAEPYQATPQTGPYTGQLCTGVTFRAIGPGPICGFALGIHLLTYLRELPEFAWHKNTPSSTPFIDLLTGSRDLRLAIDAGSSADDILAAWT